MFVEGLVTKEELKKIQDRGYDIIYAVMTYADAKREKLISEQATKEFWKQTLDGNCYIWVKIFVDSDVYEYLST